LCTHCRWSVIGITRVVCGTGSVHRYCLSARLSRHGPTATNPLLQVCCCRKYRLIAARRANAGSATLSAYVVAEHRPVISPTATLQFKLSHTTVFRGWLGSRVVSVLDSGAEGPGFKSQPRRCRVTVLGKLFTPIVPLFAKQQNW